MKGEYRSPEFKRYWVVKEVTYDPEREIGSRPAFETEWSVELDHNPLEEPSIEGEVPTPGEWKAHQAFYRLTVAQRDMAWREVENLTENLKRYREAQRPN